MGNSANQSKLFSFDFAGKRFCADNRITSNAPWFAKPLVRHCNLWRFSVFRRGDLPSHQFTCCRTFQTTTSTGLSRHSGILTKHFINNKY